jgi:uncharacterized protein (DUF1501 family)
MNRRKFLKGATVSMLPIVLGGFPMRAFSRTQILNAIGKQYELNGHVLVVIQLAGGNDGLNTVIPYAMSQYYNARPTIGIPAAQVLQLNSVMGLHPSLNALLPFYNNGKVAIVQGVGYASPNRSHFRSTDIWFSATDSSVTLNTGWLGRDLNYNYPNYPEVLAPNPLALQIGGSPSLGLQSVKGPMGVTITDPNQFYQLITGTVGFVEDPPPNTPAGAELLYLRTVEQEAVQYATAIKHAADLATNRTTYPNTNLAAQLAIVARLIAGGLDCPIYLVSQTGFDTHSSQVSRQATLMTELGGAIAAFQTDLELLGVANNVVGMTFSEFGRRIAENGSAGTDHGTSSPQIVFGTRVVGGFQGPNPNFNNLDPVGDFIYDIDFRRLYATMLGAWFGASEAELQTVLLRHFDQLPMIQSTGAALNKGELPDAFALKQNYPNPFNPTTTITYDVPEDSYVTLQVFNEVGQQVEELYRGARPQGRYMATFEAKGLASGVYYCRLRSNSGYAETRKMLLVK